MNDNDPTCKTTKGCIVKCALPVAAVFIFIFAYNSVVHSIILSPLYLQTSALWRTPEEMARTFPFLLLCYLALSVLFTAIYCKCKKMKRDCGMDSAADETDCRIGGPNCPIKHSLCFGVTIGLFMGILNAMPYVWLPIPLSLAVAWFIVALVQGIGIGTILSITCGKMKKTDEV